jgi:hypothetical protein
MMGGDVWHIRDGYALERMHSGFDFGKRAHGQGLNQETGDSGEGFKDLRARAHLGKCEGA